MRPPKILVFVTLTLLVCFVVITSIFLKLRHPDSIVINTQGQPTLGFAKATVHVVVFEEPKCVNCRSYTERVYPKIKKNYIDTNKITYTVIPVSFLPGSMPAACALLCVYNADPRYPNSDLYFAYLDYLYAHQPDEHTDWATAATLVRFAQGTSPAIDTEKLKWCVQKEGYRAKVQQNTDYGQKIMGGSIATPMVYVNGVAAEELSYEHIRTLIDNALNRGG